MSRNVKSSWASRRVSARQALRIIGHYRRRRGGEACRWVIEEYHKVQKSGCGLEHSQLHDVDA